tara:strand:+ start:438 stop:677 length:240 start_codon:yes stop_codon:yes gene_type:complete
MAIKDKIELFINELMCRRESNQRKANKLWQEIKPHLKKKDANLFETEWRGHYIHTGEHTPNDMAYWVEHILKPYIDEQT